MDEYGVGLDIGGTKVHGVLVDGAGTILREARTPTGSGGDAVVASAVRVFEELLSDGPEATRLWATGVGIPGLVDPATGTVSHAVNLGIDGTYPLAKELTERLGHAVIVENDVNAAAFGAARRLGLSDMAYLGIGTGLAAGLVLDGRLRRGLGGAAGEIGHLVVVPNGRRCNCGQRGCLETIASGSALAIELPGDDASSETVFDLDAGPELTAVRDRFSDAVALAVRILCQTADVAAVVLGGGVTSVGEPLRAGVAASLDEQSERSGLIGSMRLSERVMLMPDGLPAAAIGAGLLGAA